MKILIANGLFLSVLLAAAVPVGPASAQTPTPAPSSPAQTAPSSQTAPPESTPAEQTSAHGHGFRPPKIGVDLGLFIPSDGKTRSRFGSAWTSIGVGLGRIDHPSRAGRFGLDFSVTMKSSGDHHAFFAPIGVSYRRALSDPFVIGGHKFIPYYGVSADLVVLDLRSPEDDVHSRVRLSEGGAAVLGTTIGKSGFLEGKYIGVAKVKGFDLSGYQLEAGIRF